MRGEIIGERSSSSGQSSEVAELSPTTPRERIEILDVIRGFALFGIFVANMAAFKSPGGESPWNGALDHAVIRGIAVLVSMKFVTLFSFLFGLGFALQMVRAEAQGARFVPLYLRRQSVLLVIGLVHGFLIWFGDILALYAVLGMLLLLFRALSPRVLLACAVALFLLSFVKWELILWEQVHAAPHRDHSVVSRSVGETPGQSDPERERALQAYGRGRLAEVISQRARDAWFAYSASFDPSVASNPALRVLGLFLLGLYTGRKGIIQDVRGNRAFLRKLWVGGLACGLAGTVSLFFLYRPSVSPWLRLARPWATALGVLGLSSFYLSTVAVLFAKPSWRPAAAYLSATGRMALSNYLLQSIICTTVFYSYGLGLYGKVGPAAGLVLTVLIFSLQAGISAWWLRRFRFGPAEWVWRSLTYGKAQPMRVQV